MSDLTREAREAAREHPSLAHLLEALARECERLEGLFKDQITMEPSYPDD